MRLCIGILQKRFQSSSKAILYTLTPESIKSYSFPHLTPECRDSLSSQLNNSLFSGEKDQVRWFYGFKDYNIIGVAGLGMQSQVGPKEYRKVTSQFVKGIQSLVKSSNVEVSFGWNAYPQETAEGAHLSTYSFTDTKSKPKEPVGKISFEWLDSSSVDLWKRGTVLANAQNIARNLSETSANYMTPSLFCQRADSLVGKYKHLDVQVNVHDKEWAENQKMGAFLSVGRGSNEPLKFLELSFHNNPKGNWHALVGKGVTFDSGGISIKPSSGMALMKGDMAGAASALASFVAAVELNLKLNLAVVIPLTENMPSGTATKPGDVVIASNNKTIEVDNTDAEGRLILADALDYVIKAWNPKSVVELSTLTGAMDVALGYPYAGVFTNSDSLWNELCVSGDKANDPFWRMPLCSSYKPQIKSQVADLKNVGGRGAGSCTAAIFLNEFVVPDVPFAHIDIAGVFHKQGGTDFLTDGMTGRPTRSIIEYLIMKSH